VAVVPLSEEEIPLTGLTSAQVAHRVQQELTNNTGQSNSPPLWHIIRRNTVTPFNALLGALAVIVLLTGSWKDALFALVLVANSLVGIIQEVRAKRTLDQLAVLNAPLARATRDGETIEIAVEDVVQDDILQLRTGDQVVADGTLRATDGLEVDESLLTGESDPVAKQPGNEVLSGSIVVAGSGTAQVSRVGADNFASKLASEARAYRLTRSELVDGINTILRYVAIGLIVAGPILLYSELQSSPFRKAVQGVVAAMVGMVPEGLVLLASVTFFAAALALARRRVLVQELPAVEGLARVDVLCLDKTGTLTQGDITFASIEPFGDANPDAKTDTSPDANPDVKTDASPDAKTDGKIEAVLGAIAASEQDNANATLLAIRHAFDPPEGWMRTANVPFSSARKWSAAAFDGRGTFVLGAPEMVWPTTNRDDPVRARADEAAAQGSRTLLLAETDRPLDGDSLPADLRPVGLVLFEERVRPDAAETLQYFGAQGVGLRVISGDNPRTVAAVARRVGFPGAEAAFDARQLPDDPAAVAEVMDDNSVFGRVTPQQKRAMVTGLHARGHVVAMTGDGVNDALALKDADIGVAMGSGAAATRSVAQLVLLDDQFAAMPGVVAEGRRVIANVERVANLFLTKNVTSFVLALLVAIVGWPYPFLPRHLTLISDVAIGIPGFFLALGPSNTRFEPGFVRRVMFFALPVGTLDAVAVMIAYGLARAQNVTPDKAKTAATIVFIMVSLWVLVVQARPLNMWKQVLVGSMAGLASLAFVTPFGRSFFNLNFPSADVTVEAFALGAAGAVAVEMWVRAAGLLQQRGRRQAERTGRPSRS
jgi:cation-transporting ATPase E